jgi:hypothetical protein
VKRYKVVTTEGWQIGPHTGSTSRPPGMTVSILDTRNIHREVKRFRTEDVSNRVSGPVHRRRVVLLQAQEYADKLNAECERT